jgi:putative peptidoglycan lipid II flippase
MIKRKTQKKMDRIKKIVQSQIQGLHQAAYLLGLFAILSQVFALIRDRLLASTFGAGLELDMYYAAFRLPDIIFVLLVTFFSVSVLVPLVVERLDNKKELERYFNSLFTFVCICTVFVFIGAWYFTPFFLSILVPEIYLQNTDTLIIITRILLIQPLLLSLSGFFGSFAQAQKKFLLYALSPVMYNIGIIVGIAVLYPIYGLYGLVSGVVLGALLHLMILAPFVFETYTPHFSKIYFRDIKKIITHSIPRTFSLLFNQILLIGVTFFAGLLALGSISIFNLSFNLQSVPLAIIGVSYSLAAFPSLALFFKEKKYEEFYELLSRAMRHVFFWSLPVVALFIILRAQIVRVILGSGNFDWNETMLVAAALAIFTISLVAQSASQVLIRAFYAMNRTTYPFMSTVVSFIVTMGVMCVLFIPNIEKSSFMFYLETFLKVDNTISSLVLIIPIAFSLGQWVQFLMLILGIGKIKKIFSKQFFTSIAQSFLGAGVIALVCYISLQFFSGVFDLNTFVGITMQGLISGGLGVVFGLLFLILIGNKEIKTVLDMSFKKIKRQTIIQPEVQEEL